MELPGHVGLALLVFAPVAFFELRRGRFRRAWTGLAVVIALSVSPDVDLYLASVSHRGVTHTALAALSIGGIVGTVAGLSQVGASGVSMGRARFGAVVGALAVASHLLGDVITPMGIRPFLPISARSYTLSLVPASDPAANRALLVAGIVALGIAIGLARKQSPMPDRDPDPTSTPDADGETRA